MLRRAIPLAVVGISFGLALGAEAGKQKWVPVGLCGGGGLFNPVVSPHDPQTMLVESDMGGRYISRDGGQSWTMIHHLQIGSAVRGASPLVHPARPGLIYALSGFQADAVHFSPDNGKTWAAWSEDRQPHSGVIRLMYIDPDRPERFFVSTADGTRSPSGDSSPLGASLLFTDDEGKKWQQSQGVSGEAFHIVAERSSGAAKRVYFVGTPAGVFRSDDGGRSFAKKTQGLPAGRLAGFAGGSNQSGTVLYAAARCRLEEGKLEGGLYVSTDKGESWRRAMNPEIDVSTQRTSPWARGDLPQYSHLLADDADPKRAYVYCGGTSYFPPNHSTIYRTDDAGASWRAVFFVDPRFKQCNVARDWMSSFTHQSWVGGPIDMEISPTDPDVMMRVDGMFMFITKDAGKNWFPGHAVKANDATADRDITWKNNGLVNTTTWHYYVDPHQASRHYIAYTDIGFARSLDGGLTWRWWGPGKGPGELPEDQTEDFPIPRAWVNTCYELAFDPEVPGKLWGAFSGHHDIPNENSIWRGTGRSGAKGGICRSLDFGVTWQALRNGLPERPALSVVLDPSSPKGKRTLYAAIYDNGVYKSTDDGATWTKRSEGLGHADNLRVCRIQLHGDRTLFALVTGMRVPANGPFTSKGVGLYRSRDAGESWELVNASCPLLYPKDFGVDPADSKVIFIGACDLPPPGDKQGGLYRTTDGGKTWQRVLRKRNTHFGAYFHPKRKGRGLRSQEGSARGLGASWVYATCCGWSDAPEGSLFLSQDAGKTWRPFTELPFAQINRVDFDANDPEVIYATTFGGSVWKGPAEP